MDTDRTIGSNMLLNRVRRHRFIVLIQIALNRGKDCNFHAVDPQGIGIEFIGNVGTGTIRGKGQATAYFTGQQVEDFILGSAIGVGRDDGFVNRIIGQLETDWEQLETGFILGVELVDELLDVVAQTALGDEAAAVVVDALEQALGGLGSFDDLGVADGIGKQVKGGCRNRFKHGGTSFLWQEPFSGLFRRQDKIRSCLLRAPGGHSFQRCRHMQRGLRCGILRSCHAGGL